jgi:phosphoribosylaminoimidazolecarboxamide formyltransferase/IMP cyclohydrolase
MPEKLQAAYRKIVEDPFPPVWEQRLIYDPTDDSKTKVLRFEKQTWTIPDTKTGELVEQGLRYGENPGQPAALYKLVNGNITFGDVATIQPGMHLASNAELLQSGKHPGKTNITDADNALNILRYFMDEPVVSIMKHNNPCGVAIGKDLSDAYLKADAADRVAAFGGAIALNRACDKATAEAIAERYSEVVAAPEYEEGVMDIFAKKKNLRVMRIRDMARLKQWIGQRFIDIKSLMDGGFIAQLSYSPEATTLDDIRALPLGYHEHDGTRYEIKRKPTEQEFRDMRFGWLVESGITSNSVIYVKDGATVGIGTGEQDRVGVAEIARDKAYTKLRDRLCFERLGISYNELLLKAESEDRKQRTEALMRKNEIYEDAERIHGGLEGAAAVSDAFFPKRDGVDVVLREGVKAIIQPGGSIADYESVEACNESDATMVFTGQRSFRH